MFTWHPESEPTKGELTFFKRLREALEPHADKWECYHGVRFEKAGRPSVATREADIVLINRKAGVIGLEVKGSVLSYEGSTWKQLNKGTGKWNEKRCVEQAEGLRSWLNGIYANDPMASGRAAGIVSALTFFETERKAPDGGLIGGLDPNRFIWKEDFGGDLGARLLTILAYYRSVERWQESAIAATAASIASHLSKAWKASPSAIRSARQYYQTKLTDEQSAAIKDQDAEVNKRFLLMGCAGSGKTMCAQHVAAEWSQHGRVLLLCKNPFLAKHLKARMPDRNANLVISSFSSFASDFAGITTSNDKELEDDFASLPSTVKRERFHAIIIDEGQDLAPVIKAFEDDWLLDPAQSKMFVCWDNNQKVYLRTLGADVDLIFPQGWSKKQLKENMRNRKENGRAMAQFYDGPPIDFKLEAGHLEWVSSHSPEEDIKAVAGLVGRLKDQGESCEDIAVLYCQDTHPILLAKSLQINGKPHYINGLGKNRLTVHSVKEFKGLECHICILLPGPIDARAYEGPEERRIAYIGTGRGCFGLYIVGKPELKHAFGF